MTNFDDIAVRSIEGSPDLLGGLRGKVVLAVNGPSRHPLYAFLTSRETGVAGDIAWNFEKFLIGRDGRVLKRYPPPTPPQDKGLMQDIADAF